MGPIWNAEHSSRRRTPGLLAVSAVMFVLAAAVIAPVAAIAARRVAVTKPATAITETSAILNGVATPAVADSEWLFEWGTTRALGHFTDSQAIGAGRTPVSQMLTQLKPRTTYYFRLVVIEGSYASTAHHGTTLHFKTKP